MPSKRDDLTASAELGKRVAALLDTENSVVGVTAGSIMPELRTLGVATHIEGKQFDDDDFRVTAGWGHGGKGGVTMPGKGKAFVRNMTEAEIAAMPLYLRKSSAFPDSAAKDESGSAAGGEASTAVGDLTMKQSFTANRKAEPETATGGATSGINTLDIYLNNFAYWRNVPERVWNFYIGGYQVIKKWLSYREYDLFKRPLKLEEVEEVTNMIRRIAAILLVEPELNANYQKIKTNTYNRTAAVTDETKVPSNNSI